MPVSDALDSGSTPNECLIQDHPLTNMAVSISKYALLASLLAQITIERVGLAFLSCVVAAIGWQIVYNHFFHPLAKFPGPFWAGVTRLWSAWHHVRETETPLLYELVKKHGTLAFCIVYDFFAGWR